MASKDFEKLYLQEKKINDLICSVNQAEDVNEIFLDLKDGLCNLFCCERITIYAVDKKRNQLYSRIKTGKEPIEIRVDIDEKSIAGFVAKHRCMVNVKDVYDLDEITKSYPGLNFDSSWDKKIWF